MSAAPSAPSAAPSAPSAAVLAMRARWAARGPYPCRVCMTALHGAALDGEPTAYVPQCYFKHCVHEKCVASLSPDAVCPECDYLQSKIRPRHADKIKCVINNNFVDYLYIYLPAALTYRKLEALLKLTPHRDRFGLFNNQGDDMLQVFVDVKPDEYYFITPDTLHIVPLDVPSATDEERAAINEGLLAAGAIVAE